MPDTASTATLVRKGRTPKPNPILKTSHQNTNTTELNAQKDQTKTGQDLSRKGPMREVKKHFQRQIKTTVEYMTNHHTDGFTQTDATTN